MTKEFPALTPYEVDERTFYEVIDLYSDVRRMQIRDKKHEEAPNKPKVIRRPASDDWF